MLCQCLDYPVILDISPVLCFWFNQPVLYLDPSTKFPHSKEKPGFYGGVSQNVGDMMTFKIVTANYKTILHRSVVRPADDPLRRNKHVTFGKEVDKKLRQLDGGAVDEGPVKASSPGNGGKKKDAGIAKRTRSNIAPEGVPVATRTRSRHTNLVLSDDSSERRTQKQYLLEKIIHEQTIY